MFLFHSFRFIFIYFFLKNKKFPFKSRNRCHNQKRRMIRSTEDRTNGVGRRTPILLMTIAYDQIKTRLPESEAEAEE